MKPDTLQPSDYQNIVDVRTSDEYLREHIPGSINIPLDTLASATPQLSTMSNIYLSCQSGKRAEQALQQLQSMGIRNAQLLEGSLNGWKQRGYPTEKKLSGISIMRQVQIIVGLMVFIGLIFPQFSALTWLAGFGMLIAGLTNTCMMAVALSKLPWNRSIPSDCQI